MATVDVSCGADNESAVFSSHLAAGLTCQVGETSRLYVYYSTVLNVVNKVRQSNGTVVNPVHAADVLSVGFNHRF
ncbi:hypothetical protein LBMAG55_09370 [Verrucomicrobiota bacterium]|nr:hypothetical protein EMGBD4_04530 [Verrucomicrobiota bacterium]GDY17614.1 hypothetical protein LBMAG55_09370 [Verrucomicrobiota bacterium]